MEMTTEEDTVLQNSSSREENSPPEVNEQNRGVLAELLPFIIVALLVVIPLRLFIAQPFVVTGESMVPTFENGDYLIVDQLSMHLRDPHRGEVIIFRFPDNQKKFFIKRVIGLPGELVEIVGNDIFTTTTAGEKLLLDEPYIKLSISGRLSRRLSEGEYFVMGDNRPASSDSRSWGPVTRDLIVGRPIIRLLPIREIDVLPGNFAQVAAFTHNQE